MDPCHDPAVSRIEWRKASYSSSNGGACVEVALSSNAVAVRDSKNPDGPRLAFALDAWKTFTTELKGGKFSIP
jgi:Domain of unknown function (DUF397)